MSLEELIAQALRASADPAWMPAEQRAFWDQRQPGTAQPVGYGQWPAAPMDALDASALIPGVGDITGPMADARMFLRDPEQLTPGNLGLAGLGLLPFFSGVLRNWDADLVKRAKKHFGLTRDPREAGYILPTGEFLDFSGRHYTGPSEWPYLSGQRNVDHRELGGLVDQGGSEGMAEFMRRSGALRNMPGIGVTAAGDITEKQAKVLSGLAGMMDDPLIVDFSRPADLATIESWETASRLPGAYTKKFESIYPSASSVQVEYVDPPKPVGSAWIWDKGSSREAMEKQAANLRDQGYIAEVLPGWGQTSPQTMQNRETPHYWSLWVKKGAGK